VDRTSAQARRPDPAPEAHPSTPEAHPSTWQQWQTATGGKALPNGLGPTTPGARPPPLTGTRPKAPPLSAATPGIPSPSSASFGPCHKQLCPCPGFKSGPGPGPGSGSGPGSGPDEALPSSWEHLVPRLRLFWGILRPDRRGLVHKGQVPRNRSQGTGRAFSERRHEDPAPERVRAPPQSL